MKSLRILWLGLALAALLLTGCGAVTPSPEPDSPPVVEPVLGPGSAPVQPPLSANNAPANTSSQPEGTSMQATLKAESGQVELYRSDESGYASLSNGQSVSVGAGDVIRTGSDGLATLAFEPNTETTIFPNTVLALDSLTRTSSGVSDLRLLQLVGRTFSRVNFATAGSQQQFSTPYGVASVRGTSYWLEVKVDGASATTLLTQTLAAFEAQLGATVPSGDLRALALLVVDLLSNKPGTTQLDVDFGAVIFTDLLGNSVEVHACVSALAAVDASGRASKAVTAASDLCSETASARFCGDGSCDPYLNETAATCSADCGAGGRFCGDGSCDAYLGETAATCRLDCRAVNRFCGDGSCDPYLGETTATCSADCR